MTPETLLSWMRQPEALDRGTLEELCMLLARYPYFQTARLLYLKNLYVLRDASFADELRQAVLFVADRRMLFQLIEGCLYDRRAAGKARLAAAAEKEEPSVDRTLALIDAFLADMPEEQSKQMELDYTMDYMAYLMQGSADDGGAGGPGEETLDVPRLRGQELIDGFLKRAGNETPEESVKVEITEPFVQNEELFQTQDVPSAKDDAEEDDDEGTENQTAASDLGDSYFTETLAKIYIKQHRYEKALEIIKKLSLNYPKKNAYFADQIRFLEKLIINAKSK